MPAPPLTPLAAAVLHVGAPERVLEIDCEDGEATLFLAREFPRARVRGVDRSEREIRRAVARVGLDPEGRVAFKVGRPGDLPFPEDQFDLLVLVDSIPSAGEAARVLRTGGYLILARRHAAGPWSGPARSLLRRRLARHGFTPICSETAGDGSFSVLRLAAG